MADPLCTKSYACALGPLHDGPCSMLRGPAEMLGVENSNRSTIADMEAARDRMLSAEPRHELPPIIVSASSTVDEVRAQAGYAPLGGVEGSRLIGTGLATVQQAWNASHRGPGPHPALGQTLFGMPVQVSTLIPPGMGALVPAHLGAEMVDLLERRPAPMGSLTVHDFAQNTRGAEVSSVLFGDWQIRMIESAEHQAARRNLKGRAWVSVAAGTKHGGDRGRGMRCPYCGELAFGVDGVAGTLWTDPGSGIVHMACDGWALAEVSKNDEEEAARERRWEAAARRLANETGVAVDAVVGAPLGVSDRKSWRNARRHRTNTRARVGLER